MGISDSSQIPLINHNACSAITLLPIPSVILNWPLPIMSQPPKPILVYLCRGHVCFHHNFTTSPFLEMGICHYTYLATIKCNIGFQAASGPSDVPHLNGKVPISLPGLIPQTQPNYT